MRGKHGNHTTDNRYKGITPADAGKTRRAAGIIIKYEDHPRGCGENTPGGDAAFARAGSPPRMRGKPPSRFWAAIRYRITPADAGKTARA